MELVQYIPDVQDGPDYSSLESTLVSTTVPRRPISLNGRHQQRHTESADVTVDELENDYDVDPANYPFTTINSIHELFAGVVFHEHLNKTENFGSETSIICFSVDESGAEWLQLDDKSLSDLIERASKRDINASASQAENDAKKGRKALCFFLPLDLEPLDTNSTAEAEKKTSFGYHLPMTSSNVNQLFEKLQLNPAFLPNLLGRPDYWAPQRRWQEDGGAFFGCDFWCQHTRWNLQVQGAPLSVYCKYDVQKDLTVYLVSHKRGDTVVDKVCKQLALWVRHKGLRDMTEVLLDSPFDLHVMISELNFEASHWHIARLRRVQWDAVNKVDNHLTGKDQHDRKKLADLLKTLQIVTQNSDSHVANAQIFLFTARGMRGVVSKLQVSKRGQTRQAAMDKLGYLIASMEKQHMWVMNYKGRISGLMTLVFHFNQQTDALNTIELAADMKRDSTSMNAIAALTMIFLPGTFIAVSIVATALPCRH